MLKEEVHIVIFIAFAGMVAFLIPAFALAGSQTYTTPGTYSFTVPAYGSLTMQVWGAGGGGGAYGGSSGSAGGYSAFSSVVGYGGAGGTYPDGGAGGSASGGTTNTSGQSGGTGSKWASSGGAGANGGAGGAPGSAGTAPGGGGGSGILGGGGGGGGYSTKTYTQGQITGEVTVVAGGGGSGGSSAYGNGGAGARGQVSITWTDPPAPTCTVWADTNPLAYGANTNLRWTSSNATSFYINNVGYVTPNQTSNTSVGPLSTTNYGGTASGAGGSVGCSFTLTVNPPANCTFNGQTVLHNNSVTAYFTSTVPYGSSCTSQTRTCNNWTLSGTYQYASCAIGPTCSLSVQPTSIVQGNNSTLAWTSINATSCAGNNFNTGNAASGNVSVSPSQTTTYTGSCTGPGGSANCSSATLTVTCTPAYTCSGSTIVYTNAQCQASNQTTCVSPSYCSPGSAVCLWPNPIFNPGGSLSGHLQARPQLVKKGDVSHLYWNVSNVLSCTVSGNGDSWSTLTSGPSGATTSPVYSQVHYTLVCPKYPDGSTSVEEGVDISIIPETQEI